MPWSREQQNEAWRSWYRRNREKKIGWQTRRRRAIRKMIFDAKAAAGCSSCSEKDAVCLAFHHRDPATKRFDLGVAASGSWSLEAVRAEMGKCAVLCANCHAKLHWLRRGA